MNHAGSLRDDSLAIFLFHGVVEDPQRDVRNYTRKHMAAREFRRLLEGLASEGRAVSMEDVVSSAFGGPPLPPRAFALTFDDGFANNLTVAGPILEDLGLPACFYITSGFVALNAMSWIDRIELCLEQAPAGAVRLPWAGGPRTFSAPAERIAVLEEVRREAKHMPGLDLHGLADDLFRQCGLAPVRSGDGPLDRKLSWEQVRALAGNPLFTVGGHTRSHAILSFCAQDELAQEVDGCLDDLDRLADVGPRHFSYPEGLEHCYSPAVVERLCDRGVLCCPTAILGLNSRSLTPQDLFHLKRIMV